MEPLGSRLGLFYLSKVIDLKFFFRLDFEPVLQVCLYIKGKLGVGVCRVLVLWMLRQIVLLGVERADALHLDDAAAGGHDSQLIHAHQFFATMSSGELKKVANIKEFIFVATILIIFQPDSYCLTCTIREYEL